jgi:hypothetical protein
MKIDREVFQDAIEKAKVALPNSGMQDRVLTLKGDAVLALRHNMFSSIKCDHELECSIPAADLVHVMGKYTMSDELTLKQTEEILQIRCGRSRSNLPIYEKDDYETILSLLPLTVSWTDIPLDLKEGISMCLLSDKKTQWSGVYMDSEKFLSTDARILTRYEKENKARPSFWFDRDSAVAVQSILSHGTFVWAQSDDPSWLYLRDDEISTYGVRSLSLSQHQFDFIERMYKRYSEAERVVRVVLPEDLDKTLDRLSVFGKGKESHIEMKIIPGKELFLRSGGITGNIIESVAAETEWMKEQTLEGAVDFSLFVHCCKHSHEFFIVQVSDNHPVIMFSSGPWSALLMLAPLEYEGSVKA